MKDDDFFNSPDWKAFAARFADHTLPMIRDSAVGITWTPGDSGDFSVQSATELGFMLLLGKPILLLVQPGGKVPEGLRRAAEAIVEGDFSDPGTAALFRQALGDLGVVPDE